MTDSASTVTVIGHPIGADIERVLGFVSWGRSALSSAGHWPLAVGHMPMPAAAVRSPSMGGSVIIEAGEPCPLPEDPLLAEAAAIVRDNRDWGWVVDQEWRLVYVTDEQRRSLALGGPMVPIAIGDHLFGPEMLRLGEEWRIGGTWDKFFQTWGGLIVADLSGGRKELRNCRFCDIPASHS